MTEPGQPPAEEDLPPIEAYGEVAIPEEDLWREADEADEAAR